jgi:ubiquinone/menaquinone biosynthesis C-methylase UbiE
VLDTLSLATAERAIDVGSGPGLLAYDMAAVVGPEGRVCGIDLSEAMLARKRCASQPWAEFKTADATRLPFATGSFDAAVSTQVYE